MYDELTRGDVQKMQEEIDYRVQVLRPKLIEDVQTARAFGDLSENFEYKCAKQEKNPTTEPDTTVSETTTQEETTAKSPGEALSEGASEAGSKVREGATDLSEAASRAGETVSRALE